MELQDNLRLETGDCATRLVSRWVSSSDKKMKRLCPGETEENRRDWRLSHASWRKTHASVTMSQAQTS